MLVGLEMDDECMNLLSFSGLPPWAVMLDVLAHFGAGIALGILYFSGLWWEARRRANGRGAMTTIALMVGRFALLGGMLTLASLEGPPPLLAAALGLLVGRSAVLCRVRAAVP
jgi:F1F0 ATPase subunit 2